MQATRSFRSSLGAIAGSLLVTLATPSTSTAQTVTLSRAELLDRIRGGWAGQMIGVAYGAPTEFRSLGKIGDWDLQWRDDMLENTIHQDDLYVEMTFAKVMDDLGLDATCKDYGNAFRESKYHLWHANAGARRALNQGIQAPWSGRPKYNFHANDIDFQIEADFIGLMCPGLPRESNKYCDRVGRVMNYGDGLYGGMFVCGMYAAGYLESDPRKVVEAGLACIPAESEYGQIIRDLLDWSAAHPEDWRGVWQMVEDKWDKHDPCPDGFLRPFNIDAKINGAYIVMGLLYGGGDPDKTISVATRCGQDSDCNPSSAAGVLGVMVGYDRIPAKFKAAIPTLASRKFDFTDYSFNDIVKSTEARALRIIAMTGGKVSDEAVVIQAQQPKAPKLEQWSPGIPDRRITAKEPAWTWAGDWRTDREQEVAERAGSEASLEFEGVALAVVGRLDQSGGRADVYLDGKRQKLPLDAYIVPNTHDNVLWQAYGLKPGNHTLRIVLTGIADNRSRGTQVSIWGAVVYR
ncbi:MAG: ADP-ribosylglycohydrolase family protein [Verrucomicrobiae bacterium]|nr:ADP-ribosylglycohydrolase family protein [Verrucomicrobiae bacterium]